METAHVIEILVMIPVPGDVITLEAYGVSTGMLTLCKPRAERHLWEEQTPMVFDILLSKSPRCHLTSGHQSCKLIFLPWFLLHFKTDFFLLPNP